MMTAKYTRILYVISLDATLFAVGAEAAGVEPVAVSIHAAFNKIAWNINIKLRGYLTGFVPRIALHLYQINITLKAVVF